MSHLKQVKPLLKLLVDALGHGGLLPGHSCSTYMSQTQLQGTWLAMQARMNQCVSARMRCWHRRRRYTEDTEDSLGHNATAALQQLCEQLLVVSNLLVQLVNAVEPC